MESFVNCFYFIITSLARQLKNERQQKKQKMKTVELMNGVLYSSYQTKFHDNTWANHVSCLRYEVIVYHCYCMSLKVACGVRVTYLKQ